VAVTAATSGAAAVPRLLQWPSWRRLPRDARDTLFLLAVIGWTVLPHVSHLPLWCSLLTLVVLLWRARLALANAPLPGRWSLVAFSSQLAPSYLVCPSVGAKSGNCGWPLSPAQSLLLCGWPNLFCSCKHLRLNRQHELLGSRSTRAPRYR